MNRKITKLSPHCRLILEKDKKFKYIGMEIVFKTKYRYEDITAYRVLSKILTNTSKKYPSILKMSQKKDELFDVDIGFSHSFFGKLSLLKCSCSYVHPSYVDDKDYETKVLQLVHDCLFDANICQNQFDEEMFQIAKDLVYNDILIQKDNASAHAILELLQNVGSKRQAIAASIRGDKNVLKKLDCKQLVAYYQKMIASPFDIYIVGDIQYEPMIRLIKQFFVKKTVNKKNYIPALPLSTSIVSPKIVHKNILQTRLAILYTTQKVFSDKESYALRILNDILGGGMQSKLFLEVREKKGLCYSISSTYNSSYGYLLIHTGIQAKNVKQVLQEVQKQLDAIKEGKFTQKEVQRSVDSFCRGIQSYKDDCFAYIDLHVRYASFHQPFDLEDILVQYQQVTKKQIMEVAQNIQYKTHAVLTKKGE